ncbi:MAG: radical SAM protein [Nitrospinae bacterium CG11_big_fil_rev_8_21_14_0_20_45_15]|nr:MAG: radical SAM protein [Nitrospinae bacterium CG11_big_fil_rev_8_21_14_0_20_45_15]
MKVAVCNSVGIDIDGNAMIHSPSRWTNSSKDLNIFTYYPWQLAYCSSMLKRDTDHEVRFFDGCLDKLDHDAFVEKVSEMAPDYLVMDSATRTIAADSRFAKELKKRFGTKLILCGPHATTFPEEVSEYADYVVLREYELVVRDILQGKNRNDIPGLFPNLNLRSPLDVNDLPLPEDDDVSRLRYGMPGEPSSEYLEIQAYASRGCPLSCTFCVCGNISYSRPNWRPRDPENVIHELQTLRAKYPQMEGIFFDEEVHNGSKKYIIDLTKAIRDNGLDDLKYDVMCGQWPMDEEVLDHMKAAGYYMVRLGIETAGEHAARGMELMKKFNIKKLKQLMEYGTRIGLKFYGTFTFGGEGSTDECDKKTVRFIRELLDNGLLWRFQLSISTPQPGTPFYNRMLKKGYLRNLDWKHFDGGNHCVVDNPEYPAEKVMANFREAETLYEMGFNQRYSATAKDNFSSINLDRNGEILVFRSSRMKQFNDIVNSLSERFGSAPISAVGQTAVEKELAQNKRLRDIHTYGSRPFNSSEFPEPLLESLQKRSYEIGVIPYNNISGNGYAEVKAIAKRLGIPKLLAVNVEGKVFDLDNPGDCGRSHLK